MSTNYTSDPTATRAPSPAPAPAAKPIVVIPSDGDALNAASITQALKVLADYAGFAAAGQQVAYVKSTFTGLPAPFYSTVAAAITAGAGAHKRIVVLDQTTETAVPIDISGVNGLIIDGCGSIAASIVWSTSGALFDFKGATVTVTVQNLNFKYAGAASGGGITNVVFTNSVNSGTPTYQMSNCLYGGTHQDLISADPHLTVVGVLNNVSTSNNAGIQAGAIVMRNGSALTGTTTTTTLTASDSFLGTVGCGNDSSITNCFLQDASITCGNNSTVTNCLIDTSGGGVDGGSITAGNNCKISDNTVRGTAGAHGQINVQSECVVHGNTVTGAISGQTNSIITDNIVLSNVTVSAGIASIISNNVGGSAASMAISGAADTVVSGNICNGGEILAIGNNSRASGNSALTITSTGSGCIIQGNTVLGDIAIPDDAAGKDTIIIGNTVAGNIRSTSSHAAANTTIVFGNIVVGTTFTVGPTAAGVENAQNLAPA